jgi:hypothetical protein
MTRVLEIRHLAATIREIRGTLARASTEAVIQTVTNAEAGAKRRAAAQFRGSADRPKRGWLVNAIFAGYETAARGQVLAEGFVAVRSKKGDAGTAPYGRIHEYGGTVKPKKAKWLWIPLFGPGSTGPKAAFRGLSPRDFVAGMIAQRRAAGAATGRRGGPKGRFGIIERGAGGLAFFSPAGGQGVRGKMVALFALRKHVTIPARPYVTPAVEAEMKKFGDRMAAAFGRARR